MKDREALDNIREKVQNANEALEHKTKEVCFGSLLVSKKKYGQLLPFCILVFIKSLLITLVIFLNDLVIDLSGTLSIKLNLCLRLSCHHATAAETAVLHHLVLSYRHLEVAAKLLKLLSIQFQDLVTLLLCQVQITCYILNTGVCYRV